MIGLGRGIKHESLISNKRVVDYNTFQLALSLHWLASGRIGAYYHQLGTDEFLKFCEERIDEIRSS